MMKQMNFEKDINNVKKALESETADKVEQFMFQLYQ